jgi:hypothetical protein
MAQHQISRFKSLKDMGDYVNDLAAEPFDEVHRDLNDRPMGTEEILALCREIEAETGEVLIKRIPPRSAA